MQNLKDKLIYKSENIFIFSFLFFVWAIFSQSALVQPYSWKYYLLAYRLFLTFFSLLLVLCSFRFVMRETPSLFVIACMFFQATSGCLENSNSIDFYQYTLMFFFTHCYIYRGTFKEWLRKYSVICATIILTPLHFKDISYFENPGVFIHTLTQPIVMLLFSFLILRLNCKKYHALNNVVELKAKMADHLKSEVSKYKSQLEEQEKQQIISQIASQVSHDLRSPITALEMATKDLSQLEEDTRVMIRGGLARIKDIANNLLKTRRELNAGKKINSPSQKRDSFLLSSLIEPIISEKRTQNRDKGGVHINFKMDDKTYGLFANVNQVEFKRLLSNIINNSVEALQFNNLKIIGNIEITLKGNKDSILLTVSDNGTGIPTHILKDLGREGQTFGKREGNGLGIYHAKTTIESWGGTFSIKSEVGKGTSVEMTFLKSIPPAWFTDQLYLQETTLILDDDESIHSVWSQRFRDLKIATAQSKIFHFYRVKDLQDWVSKNKNNKFLLLSDYELIGQQTNGIDIIKKLNIVNKSILVTSRYEDDNILNNCLNIGLKLIPKPLASYVPIKMA